MKKDDGMAEQRDCQRVSPAALTMRTRVLVSLCVSALACSSAGSTGAVETPPRSSVDAGGNTPPGSARGSGSGKADLTSDAAASNTSGTGAPYEMDGAVGAAADGGEHSATGAMVDAFVCLAHGVPCGGGLGTCCSDTCFKGACGGCVVEGVMPGPDATCCAGLSVTSEGYCGTAACVPDGTPCGNGTVVCCNDNCNVTCGG